MSPAPPPRERIGRYPVESVLGEGGMGVVFAARDVSLDRSVAIKMIHQANQDTDAAARLRREARTLASVNHPNVCQVYEIGDEGGDVYIVMERLEGEPLSARFGRGALPPVDALRMGLGMLAALEALHGRGLVHRDLKPSNVFLTPHGVKLLDFGLARSDLTAAKGDPSLTAVGTVVGTPRYLAPEQWGGATASSSSDLFAAGAVLYEAISGRPAFQGGNVLEIFNAVAHERPPALAGGLAVARIDSVLQRAMAKRPEERYPDAAAMAADLETVLRDMTSEHVASVRAMKRLIVLPFRMLRPDPEVDFLAFSLPDAITSSLAGLDSLVLRSSATAARFAVGTPDLKSLAQETEVDAALLGTLLRSGDQVRVAAQLVEVPSGTVQWSATVQGGMADLFTLQDNLARHIVESLAIPLSAGERRRLSRDVPATARAYEHFLRANEAARDMSSLMVARDLYKACIEDDPAFAPAWAQIGRTHRVLAKFGMGSPDDVAAASRAFARALELNPDLPVAHHLYTPYQIEYEGQALQAMVRLLERAKENPGDPNLYIGLCMACRYAGLLDASLAADERARRLDPGAASSVSYTYFQTGEYEKGLARADADPFFIPMYALVLMGRGREALAHANAILPRIPTGFFRDFVLAVQAAVEGNREMAESVSALVLPSTFKDPEGIHILAWTMAGAGADDRAVQALETIENAGFVCTNMIEREPWFAGIRERPEVRRIVEAWKRRAAEARETFRAAGGEQVLG